MKRVILGLSGGVDSAVAAYLLQKKGYQVLGLTMNLVPEGPLYKDSNTTFDQAVKDAAQVAKHLNIEHLVVDLRDEFEKTVIEYFVSEYGKGRTPNPCITCNKTIKFGAFLQEALKLDVDYIATGHYVKKIEDHGVYFLERAKDPVKDQSYFLYQLTQDILAKTLFPLGDFTKDEIRKIALKEKLPNFSRKDSEEICFVQNRKAGDFVEKRNPKLNKLGYFLSPDGKNYGQHRGLVHYTVGQRKGLGIAAGIPVYVSEIQSDSGNIIVDTKESLYKNKVWLEDVHFIAGEPELPSKITVKIRHGTKEHPAILDQQERKYRVELLEPARGVAPGQSAVFYQGNRVLGGGKIESSR